MAKSKKSNAIFIIFIALFICVLVVMGIFLVAANKNSQLLNKYSSEIESYKTEVKKEKTEKDSAISENNALKEENNALKEKNSSLEKQIEELAKKKQQQQQQQQSGQKKVCYLTFDDGPSDNTLTNLQTLARYNAKATFFVIGSAKLDYLQKISEGGHAIGLHSGCHDYARIYSSVDAYYSDLNDISAKVQNAIGNAVNIIRFPGGSSNAVSKKYCPGIMTTLTQDVQNKGYRYFDWNVSSGDAEGNNIPVDRIVNNVVSGCSNKNTVCVLMHDSSAKKTTAQALPTILERLSQMGFSFEALNDKCEGFHQHLNN